MTQPIFPNDDAILKYNVDKNGLYMNAEFGEYGYTSPYYGVSANETGYIPTFHIRSYIFIIYSTYSYFFEFLLRIVFYFIYFIHISF